MFNTRYFTIVSHVIGLLVFLSLPIIFINEGSETGNSSPEIFTKEYLLFYGCYIFLFYFNANWLIPRFFLKKKYGIYVSILLVLFIVVLFLQPFDRLISAKVRNHIHHTGDFRKPPPKKPNHSSVLESPADGPPGRRNILIDIVSLFLFVLTIAINLVVETSKQWRITQKQALVAQNEKVNAELSFFKAQINPHFLFNTLNNIYALVVSGNEKAGEAILKLSNIMRYVTDEVSNDFVPLAKEVECILDFIELQKLRLGKKIHLTCDITGEVENKRIAPLILLTFIENVFKYGLSNHVDAPITIRLTTAENTITFYSQNRIFPNRAKEERVGVGIANCKRRLDYLYPNKYSLNIEENQETFTVKLIIEI